ncbi:hypothetical protein F3Y22_tig00007204pilonHSYRG00056 [Hibiscus syriacus]|uniref:Nodulin homeobox N-terminal domain-containing protein n=1 Tax=Hibiscus syriacus TaxID=106335 RepID=A0A6A3CGG3_HIBSY|nr:hypothetical protein F3Y22_tig00007204pilonHSYRG00056 [Hibiscus syriacus]
MLKVLSEVLRLLKSGLGKSSKHLTASSDRTYPLGLLQLNAMRLADIFSNDLNFRSYITVNLRFLVCPAYLNFLIIHLRSAFGSSPNLGALEAYKSYDQDGSVHFSCSWICGLLVAVCMSYILENFLFPGPTNDMLCLHMELKGPFSEEDVA